MSKKDYCKACSFAKRGIKTRIEIEHTCEVAEENEPVDYIDFLMKVFVNHWRWDDQMKKFVIKKPV